MSFIFQVPDPVPSRQTSSVSPNLANVPSQIKDLEHEVERLRLLSQAMWELLREKLGVEDADLEKKAQEIDLRDGIQDEKISRVPLRCPRCGRISSSRHWKCLYCGLEFEKPVMG